MQDRSHAQIVKLRIDGRRRHRVKLLHFAKIVANNGDVIRPHVRHSVIVQRLHLNLKAGECRGSCGVAAVDHRHRFAPANIELQGRKQPRVQHRRLGGAFPTRKVRERVCEVQSRSDAEGEGRVGRPDHVISEVLVGPDALIDVVDEGKVGEVDVFERLVYSALDGCTRVHDYLVDDIKHRLDITHWRRQHVARVREGPGQKQVPVFLNCGAGHVGFCHVATGKRQDIRVADDLIDRQRIWSRVHLFFCFPRRDLRAVF